LTADDIRDRTEITQLLYRYARAIDDKDYETLNAVFTSDAAINYNVERGTELPFRELGKWLRQALRTFATTHHAITNPIIELDGDRAKSACHLTAAHVQVTLKGEKNYVVMHGHYSDELVRTPGGWRICRRTLESRHVEGEFLDPRNAREFNGPG
jgi:3-phenylpropionate/cinnamic acid dioxygenase small subunit